VKDGGTWKSFTGPAVDMTPVVTNSTYRLEAACTASIRIDEDGEIYLSNNVGTYGSSNGTWLISGANTEVWVARLSVTGTFTVDDIGTGRVQCNTTNIDLSVTRAIPGTKTTTFTLAFYDAASGGNLLGSKIISLVAEYDTSGGP